MEGFQDEQKDIENYIVKDGYTKLNNFKENWSDFLYVISKDNKKFVGKLYESKKFLEIYRVFIIEFNMKSFFSKEISLFLFFFLVFGVLVFMGCVCVCLCLCLCVYICLLGGQGLFYFKIVCSFT